MQEPTEEQLKQMSPAQLAEMQKQQCIFCHIISGKVSSKKVYEDDRCMAILDINPANPGHVLVIPKEHHSIMPLMPAEDVAHIFKVAKKISKAQIRVLKADSTNIFAANGAAAGQKAPHSMVHVIPRKGNDGITVFTLPKNQISSEDKEKLRQAIKKKVDQQFGIEEREPVSLEKPEPENIETTVAEPEEEPSKEGTEEEKQETKQEPEEQEPEKQEAEEQEPAEEEPAEVEATEEEQDVEEEHKMFHIPPPPEPEESAEQGEGNEEEPPNEEELPAEKSADEQPRVEEKENITEDFSVMQGVLDDNQISTTFDMPDIEVEETAGRELTEEEIKTFHIPPPEPMVEESEGGRAAEKQTVEGQAEEKGPDEKADPDMVSKVLKL